MNLMKTKVTSEALNSIKLSKPKHITLKETPNIKDTKCLTFRLDSLGTRYLRNKNPDTNEIT